MFVIDTHISSTGAWAVLNQAYILRINHYYKLHFRVLYI